MKLVNLTEELVMQELENTLKGIPGCCTCEQCSYDIAAIALNHLPPKYVVTDIGRIYTRLAQQSVQYHTQVTMEIVNAAKMVMEKPRHGEGK